MKIQSNMFAVVVSVAKANLSGWYMLLALLFFSVVLSSCDKDSDGNLASGCTTEVVAEHITCGSGEFGNVWFKTADGTYLQPWHNLTSTKSIVAGQKYSIGYKATERDGKTFKGFTCLAAVPQSQAIAIYCLSAGTNNY